MRKTMIFTAIAIAISACVKINDKDYFNGTIETIEDTYEVIKLAGERISLEDDGSNSGKLIVNDSLLIFFNHRLSTSFFAIADVRSKKNLGQFCLKGRGPLDSTTLMPIFETFEENGQTKTLLFAPNEARILVWNITESILQNVTIYDTIIPYEWRKEHLIPYLNIYKLGDDELLTYIPPKLLDYNSASTLPYYQTRTLYSNTPIDNYDIFLQSIKNKDVDDIQTQLFRSQDCIKPDKTKVAQSMSYMMQLNIIDLNSKKIKGFRLEKTPGFSIFINKMSRAKKYYCDSQADDNYIYSLYAGNPIFPENGIFEQPQLLYVFSWEGRLVNKYDLGHKVDYIALDRANNLLYAVNDRTEEIYRYDLNETN